MRRSTHIVFAIGLSGILGLWSTNWGPLLALVAGASTLLPDLDLNRSHRRLLHNMILPLVLALILVCTSLMLHLGSEVYYLIAAFILGWLSHIFLDCFTSMGVALFYPFSRRHYGLKICTSNSLICNGVVIALSILMILYAARSLFTH